MWNIILILLTLIGTVIWNSRKIVQKILGLNDRQANHPGLVEGEAYERWYKFQKFTRFFDKYHLFYIALLLMIICPVIGAFRYILEGR